MKAVISAAVFALASHATSARAQAFVRPECRGAVVAAGELAYDSDLHARWYRRFWTGSCQNLPALQCMPGSPNWNDIVSKLVKRGSDAQAGAITQTACRMGHTIGFEWARAKPVRRITTADLKIYMSTLESAPDVVVGLDRVDGLVRTAMAGPPKGR